MKAEYIAKNLAIELMHQSSYLSDGDLLEVNGNLAKARIEAEPAADVVPVVHSTWIEDECEGYHGIHCLRCRFSIPYGNVMMGYNFCPNCGADMRGEKYEAD